MDKDRDRCSDGAGPVALHNPTAVLERSATHIRLRYALLLTLFSFCLSVSPLTAQRQTGATLRGLSLTVHVGVLRPDNIHANFYNGAPNNANTLERILYSESYGNSIWNNLTEQDLIGSAVSNYHQITVAEYGDSYYKPAFQLGMGFRYDLDPSPWAWQVNFDYAKLHAQGLVLLNSGKNLTMLTNQNQYVNCPTSGTEERIYIDLGIIRKFKLRNGLDFEAAAGANINNTKVESSEIQIAGARYSILDVWQGASPSSYVGSYECVNQGGIGYGAYASLRIGFTLPAGTAMSLAYTLHYNKANLIGYNDFAFHHALGINVALNNFSFFDS